MIRSHWDFMEDASSLCHGLMTFHLGLCCPQKRKVLLLTEPLISLTLLGNDVCCFLDMTWHLVSRNKLAGKESSHQCVWTKTGFVGWKKGQAACVETHMTEVPAQFHKSASDFETHPKQDTNSISGGWGMGSLIWLVFWSNWSIKLAIHQQRVVSFPHPQIFCRCCLGGISSWPAFNIWVLELEAYNGHTGVMVGNRVEWCTVTPTNWSWNQYRYCNYTYITVATITISINITITTVSTTIT